MIWNICLGDLKNAFTLSEKKSPLVKGKTKKAFFNFLLQGFQKSLTIQLEVGAIAIVNGPLLLGMQMPSIRRICDGYCTHFQLDFSAYT